MDKNIKDFQIDQPIKFTFLGSEKKGIISKINEIENKIQIKTKKEEFFWIYLNGESNLTEIII